MTPAARRRALMAWSGGKDAALALQSLRDDPDVEVVALLTTVTADHDRVSIHGVRRSLLHAQARAVGLPLLEAVIPARASNEAYDAAMADALAGATRRFPGAGALAFGDLFLEDVRAYRESRLGALGWTPLFPIWGRPTAEVARAFVAAGHRATLVCVDTRALPAAFAGREYDERLLADLPPGVDPCGERGEFHTFVTAGPGWAAPVAVTRGEVVLREERFAYCDLLPAPVAAPVAAAGG